MIQESGDTVYVSFIIFVGALLRYFAGMALSNFAAHCDANSKWFLQQSSSLPLKRYLDIILDGVNCLTLSGRPVLVCMFPA